MRRRGPGGQGWPEAALLSTRIAVLVLVTASTGFGVGVEYYVSQSGISSIPCGKSLENACLRLAHAVQQADDDDTIYVDGRHGTGLYSFCGHKLAGSNASDTFINIDKSLEIVGLNGRPKIGCQPSAMHASITSIQRRNHAHHCLIKLRNLEFVNGELTMLNCTIQVLDVHFYNASISSDRPGCHSVSLYVTESRWLGLSRCNLTGSCLTTAVSYLTCDDIDVTISHSQFYQSRLRVNSRRSMRMRVSKTLFSNRPQEASYLGGLHLTFSSADAYIRIENSTFEKQVHPSRVNSVTNLFEAAIWLKARSRDSASNATAFLNNIRFHDNERGITLVGPFKEKHMSIRNSLFTHNTAMHAGSGVLVLLDRKTEMEIDNCSFRHNSAGRYRRKYSVQEQPGTFEVLGNEVRVNDDCCKGLITLVGKGGAIRVQRGRLHLHNSQFENNTARLLGGSVFVDIDGEIKITNSYFENTPAHDHALQGDMLYSDGKVMVSQVAMVVLSSRNSLSILRHSGNHWTLNITDVRVECPVGYDLRVTNSSAYGVTPEGLRRSYLLDQLSYFCESCPRNKYSLDMGYLNYTMKYRDWAYYTLLINGKEPTPSFTGQYLHHVIRCLPCPYGGHCLQVRFQHCPHGYCCDTPQCPTINACRPLREGTLCGRCAAGYSEALFSTDCVPDRTCGPLWLWPFALGVGFLYSMFLLGQARRSSNRRRVGGGGVTSQGRSPAGHGEGGVTSQGGLPAGHGAGLSLPYCSLRSFQLC